jgi:hypothetical protein
LEEARFFAGLLAFFALAFPIFISACCLGGILPSAAINLFVPFRSSGFVMFESSNLKVDRAAQHIRKLIKLLTENRAFSYVLETHTKTGQRATFAKKNEPIVHQAALICGDIVHNLRSGLDHAFWEVVSPFAATDDERRIIQFPFSKTAAGLNAARQNGLAERAGLKFVSAIKALRPYGEPGGNEMLWLVNEYNLRDKHRLLTAIGEYKQVTGSIIKRQIPDFPVSGTMSFGNTKGTGLGDIVWHSRGPFQIADLGSAVAPFTDVFERELDVPVDVVFEFGPGGRPRPVIQTLNGMRNAVAEAIIAMRDSVS